MIRNLLLILLLLLVSAAAYAQTTAFTYQGKLTDGVSAANGQYDLIFRLFDGSGTQIGTDLAKDDVQVTGGVFTVTLDFGSSPFTGGSADSLEIAVRPGASTGTYTTLAPRQPLTSSPYAIKSSNASAADTSANSLQLGGVAASQYVVTTDPRMTDARTPTAGSSNYIQNGTISQPASNFNISGNGVVGGRFSVGGSVQTGDTMSVTSSVANPFAIRAYSSSNGSAVEGIISGNTTLPAVFGLYSGSGTGAGVSGLNTLATGTGIISAGQGTSPTFLVAGSGLASNGLDTGVFAATISPGASQAILSSNFGSLVRVNYFNGSTLFKINGAGAVSTVVRDAAAKQRIMFAPEAPEVLLEDYGVGQLIDGKASIILDSTFAQNISVNRNHQLRVFVQLEGDCNGVYVTNKSVNGFDVVELSGGRSNVSFSWHVVANRADEVLTNTTSGSDAAPQTRISHYADLRFPLQNEDPQIVQAQPSQRKAKQ